MFRAVKLSVKTDYAARAVLELAAYSVDGPARKVEELAAVSGTSANFLVQILVELKSAGIVTSIRGKQGGYRLAKEPADISLGSVWRAVAGVVLDSPALEDEQCPEVLRQAWGEVRTSVDAAADSITFDQLLEARNRDEEMYYI